MTSQILQPTRTDLPFPGSNQTTHFVHVIHNLVSSSECQKLIESHKNLVPSNVTPETIRTREQFDDEALSELLWERLRDFYGEDRVKDEDGCWWNVTGLNERFRLCRYDKGGKFSPHYDGRRMADLDNQSFLTVNIYLNTVPEAFSGATRALASPDSAASGKVLAKIQPVLGTAAIFRDTLWHDGEELTAGEKYLLRTEVLYKREKFDFEGMYGHWNDEEKGMKALLLAEGLEDSGNREEAVKWYKKAFRLCA
ncbi:hypothetical protein K505DRAFT_383349 [Melanomma pulvis-pyrius CBS 109.77]|uniref:Prolyl 4-hydroxylase alpha subunit domain-containing protein n=1 Tax=Melanomma pulvis-pyrius CBS 109.77 TaxID=1314802 RepID=A0A6A6XVG7_9PLEO|nr:hypothetical protein K505DRAFT_383349 [Melanomma pulvis-pyrius CBS 109.77]